MIVIYSSMINFSKLPRAGSRAARKLMRGRARLPIQTILLRTLYTTGVIATVLLAPNAIKLFEYLDRSGGRAKGTRYRIAQARTRLERKGLITIANSHNLARPIMLTDRGRREIEKILLDDHVIPEQTFWDGKWRLVIFDIRESRRGVRSQLRLLLRKTGFMRLQDSVWAYPYPCDEFIALLRVHLTSGTGEMLSLVVESLEADRYLRKHFGLR